LGGPRARIRRLATTSRRWHSVDDGAGGRGSRTGSFLSHEPAQEPHAFLYEERIAHRQGLVNDQDVRVDVGNDRKGEPYDHAGLVGLDRLIDEKSPISANAAMSVKAIGHVLAA